MRNRVPTYRLNIVDKLEHTKKPYANRIAEIMKLNGIGDFQVESSMADSIIELEKLLEKKDKQIKSLSEYSDFNMLLFKCIDWLKANKFQYGFGYNENNKYWCIVEPKGNKDLRNTMQIIDCDNQHQAMFRVCEFLREELAKDEINSKEDQTVEEISVIRENLKRTIELIEEKNYEIMKINTRYDYLGNLSHFDILIQRTRL